MRVLVVVPAHNEERNLPGVVESLRRHVPDWDVAVINDASTDRTSDVARELGVRVLDLPVNLGIGGAVQTGYLFARQGGYDAAVQFDGDGQHDASFLKALLAPLEAGSADLVIGSRFLQSAGFRSTWARRIGIRYLCWFLRLRCGARVTDPTSGMRAAGKRALDDFAAHYPSDYAEPESIALCIRKRFAIAEIPVCMLERRHGRSSIGSLRTLYYFVKVSLALLLLPPVTRQADQAASASERT